MAKDYVAVNMNVLNGEFQLTIVDIKKDPDDPKKEIVIDIALDDMFALIINAIRGAF